MVVACSPRLTMLLAKAAQKKNSPKEKRRASWNTALEKILVELLHEHNTPEYRGQNGWTSEAWNKIVKEFHEKDRYVCLTKSQIQEKEKELKREYRMLKEARKQTKKFRTKSFPLFEALGELYDGCDRTYNFTSIEPLQHSIITQVEKEKEPKRQNKSVGVEGLMERYLDMRTKQTEDEAAQLAREKEAQLAREKEAHLAREKESNDFSIKRCISVLNSMDVTKAEKVKAYTVFKNAENREIFVSACDEDPESALSWLRSEMA
ncbi:hypothetical protein DAI22_08g194111 [Oryza sativa Japonica Group]|nr:hypothetical protein DAI22_08g194111 [Oryza sativa Japonica Group]